MAVEVLREDVTSVEVGSVIRAHLDFCFSSTPAEGVFAMAADELAANNITLFGIRVNKELRGICALKALNDQHGELKSMHVLSASRGLGLAATLVNEVLTKAKIMGFRRVSLETGTSEAFAPARRLYERLGFSYTDAFGSYEDLETSVFMTMYLH